MADAAKPKRRLPFKPTALRQKSDPKPALKDNGDEDDDDDGLNLFKRSAEFFPVAVAEQERRMKRKQAEREKGSQARSPDVETKPAPRASEEPGRRDEDSRELGTPPSKRSRTSDESPQSRVKLSPTKRRDGTETPSKRMTRAAASRTPRKQEVIPTKPVISIDDSDDDPDEEDGGRPEDDDDDDIYEASPIRKFNRRRQTSEPANSPPLVIDIDSPSAEGGHSEDDPAPPQEEDDDEFKEYVQRAMERKKALEQEANQTVNVLVTSDIPGTKERQFRFTLVKPLKILRNAWIDVQEGRLGIPRADLESVFLTWRGHELYDLTTLHSLDLAGTFRRSGGGSDADAGEGFRNDWTNVHMQMWTRELWEEHERQEARRRRHDIGEYSDDEGPGNGGDERGGVPPAVEQEAEKKIKVLLKTKTDEPLKTSVRPSTTVGTIMALFRKMRGLAADAPISLMFDGDELEEDMTVEDADIGDMETIEVYIR
ncbi:Putative Ubiquitin-like domain-containing protein [Colletotrichum destructivum]|uniref:Ubiquitin-like domain-containing protein n=1 Tax=Colletotrichum destructivum TaxID=34406 RepID=A0AAX4IN31_9PEZI|nr:Putative Ubiquitin-like domain-containing protein [Colletotrichum destructivum]